MAQSSACSSLCQNPPFDGKDKLAGWTPTKGSDCCTLLPPRHVFLLLLLYLYQLLLCLLFLAPPTPPSLGTQRMTCSWLSGPFLRPSLFLFRLLHLFGLLSLSPLCTMKAHMSGLWKFGSRTFIRVKRILSVTISSSSAKITLLPPMPQA